MWFLRQIVISKENFVVVVHPKDWLTPCQKLTSQWFSTTMPTSNTLAKITQIAGHPMRYNPEPQISLTLFIKKTQWAEKVKVSAKMWKYFLEYKFSTI